MESFVVSGEITFSGKPNLPAEARAYVRLLDTSDADAPARVIAEQVLEGISQDANSGKHLTFALNGEGDQRRTYTVAVLVDCDADGKTGSGDFINMQSYPVHTSGHPDWVSILVRRVT